MMPSRCVLLLAALLCAPLAQAQGADPQKASTERKATTSAKAAPTQAAKPADSVNAKAVKPSSQRLLPARQSTPAPYKDEASCHAKSSDA